MKLYFAEKSVSWRAVYLHREDWRGSQVARLGVDPTASKPCIFGAIYLFPYNPNNRPYGRLTRAVWKMRRWTDWDFHINIPFMIWRPGQSRLRQRWQDWIHSWDGRYRNRD